MSSATEMRDPVFWTVLGKLHGQLENVEAELEAYRTAGRMEPAQGRYVAREGLVHLREGREVDARECLQRAKILLGESSEVTALASRLDAPQERRQRSRSGGSSFWRGFWGGVATGLLGGGSGGSESSGYSSPTHYDYTTQSLHQNASFQTQLLSSQY